VARSFGAAPLTASQTPDGPWPPMVVPSALIASPLPPNISQNLAAEDGEALRPGQEISPKNQPGVGVEGVLAAQRHAGVGAGAVVVGDARRALEGDGRGSHRPQHEPDHELPAIAEPGGMNAEAVEAVEQRGLALGADDAVEV